MKGDRIAPLHIDLGITTGCNMACTYCYGVIQGRTGEKKRTDMPRDIFLDLLRDAKEIGVRSIALIGEGENTLNPALYDGITLAKEIKLDISLATNGMSIPQDKIETLMSTLTWIRFNISAATPESFWKIHKVKEKDCRQILDNIRSCVESKKKNGHKTTIGLQMVLVDNNIDQIVPLAKLGKDLGVDYLVIKGCSDTPENSLGAPVEKYLEIDSILKEAESYSDRSYSVVVKRNKLSNLGLKDFDICFGTQFILAISGDGSVFPCGHWFNVRRDEFLMGNVIQNSFKEILMSEKYWEVQKRIQQVNVNKDCESNCRQYYVSQFLWSLKNPPDHVNFI